MLSVTNHDSMAATDYQDDGRPAKRPRQDNEHDDGLRTYSLATPGPSALNSEADHSGDGAAKKNKKRPLSCGECRRLKLKCDRVFPCQSCCKRGCAEICPEGALTGGKGSRFILANTEQLHEKIKAMSERIRQLEDALQVLHTQHSTEPHPLLRQELLLIKRSPELFGVDRNGMPSSTNSDNNRRDEDDRPSLASSSSPKDATDECTSSSYMSGIHVQTGIPEDIFRLSRAFPVPVSANVDLNPHLRQRLRDMLPPRSEGQRICEQAQRNAFWHYSPDTSESFIPNLVHSVYTTSLSGLLPHRLSLFFMMLTIGTAVDCNPPQTQLTADRYHNLARAALCETAVIDDPSFDTVNTLFYMVWYLLMFSNHRRAVEQAWGIMGILSRLAQSLGLHRDGVRLKMIPEELEKRKALLWNMMNVDVRLATMLRRPPSMCIRHVDAKRPAYNSLDDSPFTSAGSTYHEWRDIFLSQCMIPVLDAIVSPVPPSYSDVLGLDAKIRDFEIPPILRLAENGGLAPRHPIGLQQSLTLSTREIGWYTDTLIRDLV
ncbi:hypothetical protein AcV5_007828 [Taiwanofungus camphoratus]|nr:hypothetical protein AcW2_007490 [Antrodia cinnamomea]KAI0927241.1 hypothetical protein AcV5_007828 [Antrodia cinnamomea]KAI0947152.1 hypothetical protein AcV7_009653 [Antrodia cinnamomea]